MEYVNITPGKYLIYKDSASGMLDSVVVTKSLLENIHHAADTSVQYIFSAFYTQEFSLTLTKFDGTLQTIWFNGMAKTSNFFFDPPDYLNLNEIYHLSGTGTDQSTSAFAYSTLFNNYPVDVYSTIPSITIEGNNYTNVIFGVTDAGLEVNEPGYNKRTFYWAKEVGIIKREIITVGGAMQTHTLVRHN
ncbi:MAG: hypothetical protein E6H08_22400 [Bacteroidetes bacterium]|nr:MAG: hypothetical protein E6H08_22400 [Bacteroidota bacterium]